MESDEIEDSSGLANVAADVGVDCQSAVNSLILDYYKKFGRKRDLEQYFSLSTAQGDLSDPRGLFWRKMKSENDSSESGGGKSESSQEVCRISIRCSVPDPCSSQDDNTHTKTESDSPPIIIEEIGGAEAAVDTSRHTYEESINSDENSQRSYDVLLDTSLKPLSPTSSITSQRKLEWDSLADVGYANESERKNSASSLSTLERLALKQQYSNNDTKQDIGPPTSHSTPLDENDKGKSTKGVVKRTTRLRKKDVDFVEVNVPHSSDMNPTQSINVNLTKHISFNVEKDGGVTIDNIKKDISVSPEKQTAQAVVTPQIRFDKEIQTSLTKTKDKYTTPANTPKPIDLDNQKIPVMISLNTLRKRIRRKKSKGIRRRLRPKNKASKDESLHQEKSAQLSEAESFEYMPGHIYNQNLKSNEERPTNTSAGNKSSLESSAGVTDSSKGSSHSFTKDLEKNIELLRATLQKRFNDSDVKNKLIKEVVTRLLSSRYRDDDSTAEFLSGLSFSSRRIGLRDNHTTTSTSDTNNTEDNKSKRPKKSILRVDKFNPNVVASTSQSAPNLLSVASSEKTIPSNLVKVTRTNDSELSSRKSSSDNAFPKTSSEELYLKYLEALKREEAYKKHLREKAMFLKQKLVSTDTVFKVPVRQEAVINNRLKDLMKDLTRNNYDDGSGDASKLEGGSNSVDFERYNAARNQRSHSVFTLSSSQSECQGKKPNLKKKQCDDVRDSNETGPSKHYCCCPQHYTKSKIGYTDSSVQVNIKCQYEDAECTEKPKLSSLECQKCRESPQNMGHVISDDAGVIKYVCLCNEKPLSARDMGDNFLIYRCSRLTNRGIQLGSTSSKISNAGIQCSGDSITKNQDDIKLIRPPCKMSDNESSSSDNIPCVRKQSKSSQTNLLVKMMYQEPGVTTTSISDGIPSTNDPLMSTKGVVGSDTPGKSIIHEATRCLQTEISINPKISDPSLTDINLVNDHDCAKLVHEKFREVSKTCSKQSDSGRKAKEEADICTSSESGKNSVKHQDIDAGIKCDYLKEFEQSSNTCAKLFKDDYQIPIQGTNMTLMVTLGSLKVNGNLEKVNQACVTDKASIVEQATCITDECSKSVQCECSNVDTIKKTEYSGVDHNSNKNNKETGTQSDNCRIEHPIKACVPETSKCNTYPKNMQIKKPLLRSNTDTDKIEKSCYVQTDLSTKMDFETKKLPHVDQITCRSTKTYESDNECRRKSDMERGITIKSPRSDSGGSTDEFRRKEDIGIQKDSPGQPKQAELGSPDKISKCVGCETESNIENKLRTKETTPTTNKQKESPKCSSDSESTYKSVHCDETKGNPSSNVQKICSNDTDIDTIKDPILNMIKDITKQYSKNDIEKMKRKRCFKEIMTVLNYLLETDDSTDPEKPSGTDIQSCNAKKPLEKVAEDCRPEQSEKSPQLTNTCNNNKVTTESSHIPTSSDLPPSSTDSATCKVLNKIKKECEKYHQKRCKAGRKCEASSSTSVNCDQCKRVHHCVCRSHKCKRSKTSVEKLQKKCVAYNLIIQTSESMISEETSCDKKCRPLQNIVVKVPKRKPMENTYKETVFKVEKPRCSPRCSSKNRSRSCPNDSEISSNEELVRKTQQCTVREYLEKNRPDFVENCFQRQNCMKFVSDIRANERAAQRDMLSLHMARQSDLTSLTADQLRSLATDIGFDLRRKKPAPKFTSEREMKKHSEKIYKTLPEVVQKKEEQKKMNMMRTNLLMAYIFNKNLQKKTLRGSVNLSNYSAVIKTS